jgi:hypothetical protein
MAVVSDTAGLIGIITLEVRDEAGELVDRRECHNLITSAGLTAFASALNWSGITDQAPNMGVDSPYLLSPLYGAVGTGTTAPATTDTTLGAELDRNVVSGSAAANGQLTWSFFFGSSQAVGTIAEAGVFGGASVDTDAGILLDHVLIAPPVTKTNTQTMTMQAIFTLVNG